MSKPSFFVTGTDTDVGKTVTSAILCAKLNYHYWKPIQAGFKEGTDTELVASLIKKEQTIPEIYKLKKPAAPSIAADEEKLTIDLAKIVKSYHEIQKTTIIEGAGGLMVPLTQNQLVIDLIKMLNLATILVARTKLGTINHTLLSIEVLKQYGIKIEGIIFSGVTKNDDPAVEKAITQFSKLPILGRVPILEKIDSTTILAATKSLTL